MSEIKIEAGATPFAKGAKITPSADMTISPLGEGEKLDVDTVQTQIRFLQGKVLTIIEASLTNDKQFNAVKSLINTAFSDQLAYTYQLCYPDTRMMTNAEAQSTLRDYDDVVNNAETID